VIHIHVFLSVDTTTPTSSLRLSLKIIWSSMQRISLDCKTGDYL
jgi:hypothetical protein